MPWLCEILIVRVPIGILIDLSGFLLGFWLICLDSDYDFEWRTKETLFALEIVEIEIETNLPEYWLLVLKVVVC